MIARELDARPRAQSRRREARTGGAEKEAILGDVIEAVIGAVYMDGGLGPAFEIIERLFGEHMGDSGTERADAKTTLQEWAQGRGLEPPAYVEVDAPRPRPRAGVHHRRTSSATSPTHAPPGPSKKLAEHKAAEAFLLREKVWKGASS